MSPERAGTSMPHRAAGSFRAVRGGAGPAPTGSRSVERAWGFSNGHGGGLAKACRAHRTRRAHGRAQSSTTSLFPASARLTSPRNQTPLLRDHTGLWRFRLRNHGVPPARDVSCPTLGLRKPHSPAARPAACRRAQLLDDAAPSTQALKAARRGHWAMGGARRRTIVVGFGSHPMRI